MDLLIAVNDVDELYVIVRTRPSVNRLAAHHRNHLAACMDLANAINGAHDKLIEMPAEEQV